MINKDFIEIQSFEGDGVDAQANIISRFKQTTIKFT